MCRTTVIETQGDACIHEAARGTSSSLRHRENNDVNVNYYDHYMCEEGLDD